MDDEYNNNNNNDEDNDNDPLRSRCMQSSLPQHDSCIHNHDDHTTATIHNPTNYKDSSPFWQMISHPTIPYILVMETAERFAYYGFRAILVRYLMESLHYRESQAIAAYGYNSSASYLTPLLGAYAADVYFGNRFTTIWIFGLFYLLGLFLLTMATTLTTSATSSSSSSHESDDNDPGWLLQQQRIWSGMGLLWICLGTGGIKPCVSSFGADQLLAPAPAAERRDPSNTTTVLPEPHHHHSTSTTTTVTESSSSVDEAVRVYFNYFYFGINIGAIVSIAVVPTIRARTGSFTYAFGTSLVAVAGALALFWYRRHHYVILVQPPGNHQMTLFRDMYQLSMKYLQSLSWMRPLCIQRWRYRNHFHQRTHSHGSDGIHHDFDRDDTVVDNGSDENRHDDDDDNDYENDSPPMEDARQILHILPILATFPVYSCLYDQQGSVWTIQASHMYVPPYLQPEQMNMINPLLIMIFIPFFDQLIYPFLQNRCQISIAPLRLMSWGMFLTAIAFTCSGFVDSAIEYRRSHDPLERQVHVMWQLPQIILLAVGEIFLSVTGLEFAYSQSPIRCKAFVTALYLSTTGIGDLLAGVLYSTIFSNMKRATVMHVCAVMMLCNLRMFISVAHWYETSTVRPDSYIQVETSEKTAETDDIELTKVG